MRMHSFYLAPVVALLLVLSGCSSIDHRAEATRFLESAPETVEIRRPDYDEWSLKNGLHVLFFQDDELPIVSGTLFVKGGSFLESKKDLGVTSMMGQMMRLGGTKDLSPNELDQKLREFAADVSSSFGPEYGTISFNALSSDVSEVFPIFRDVALHPRFDEERLDLLKTQQYESIRRRKDDPVTVAHIAADYLMYRKSSFGGVLESRDVERMTRLSLLRVHRTLLRPNSATLVVTGDISKEKLSQLVKKTFQQWKKQEGGLPELKSLPTPYPPGIYLIAGDFTQANIQAVEPGPDRHSPDRYGIRLLNNIIGDGLDSRLAKKIRADLGLAYSIYGSVNLGFPQGKNVLYIQTKSASSYEALGKAMDELRLIQEAPPEEKELRSMQLAAQSGFIFRFTSPEQILNRKVVLDFFDYPTNYDATYLENIFAVDPSDISRIASRWWNLQDLRIVVVGDRVAIENIKSGVKNHPLLSQYPLHRMKFDEIPKKIS